MAIVAVIGGQWGDEGKGKIVDLLAEKSKLVVRFSGGDNAGHTVINPYGEFKLHLVPSGIFHPGITCVLGNGVAINPTVLLHEISVLNEHNVATDKLCISDRAHVIMPYHVLLDRLEEERRGGGAIGTTLKGIGPVFTDKTARLGVRICDIVNPGLFRERLSPILELKNIIITNVYNQKPLSFQEIYDEYCKYGEQLSGYVKETIHIIHDSIERKDPILLEGSQGTMLDPDFGTYPYVTSSSPLAASSLLGSGIGPGKLDHIIGVLKAYTTRVGGGPFPTELHDEMGEHIREKAHEYGTTTGRPRRCGWFDAVVARHSTIVNGLTGIALTRLDILDDLPFIQICTGYKIKGDVITNFPTNLKLLEHCEPVYEQLPGWQEPTSHITEFDRLPSGAVRYIRRLEELISCRTDIISVGAKREQTIMVNQIG
jgi:adenylosuccinate synthase